MFDPVRVLIAAGPPRLGGAGDPRHGTGLTRFDVAAHVVYCRARRARAGFRTRASRSYWARSPQHCEALIELLFVLYGCGRWRKATPQDSKTSILDPHRGRLGAVRRQIARTRLRRPARVSASRVARQRATLRAGYPSPARTSVATWLVTSPNTRPASTPSGRSAVVRARAIAPMANDVPVPAGPTRDTIRGAKVSTCAGPGGRGDQGAELLERDGPTPARTVEQVVEIARRVVRVAS